MKTLYVDGSRDRNGNELCNQIYRWIRLLQGLSFIHEELVPDVWQQVLRRPPYRRADPHTREKLVKFRDYFQVSKLDSLTPNGPDGSHKSFQYEQFDYPIAP